MSKFIAAKSSCPACVAAIVLATAKALIVVMWLACFDALSTVLGSFAVFQMGRKNQRAVRRDRIGTSRELGALPAPRGQGLDYAASTTLP